jgi:hypothetical protein
MKYVLSALLMTINVSAMQKEDQKQLPQKHECPLALRKFKAMLSLCEIESRELGMNHARRCMDETLGIFLKECTDEAKPLSNYPAPKRNDNIHK